MIDALPHRSRAILNPWKATYPHLQSTTRSIPRMKWHKSSEEGPEDPAPIVFKLVDMVYDLRKWRITSLELTQ